MPESVSKSQSRIKFLGALGGGVLAALTLGKVGPAKAAPIRSVEHHELKFALDGREVARSMPQRLKVGDRVALMDSMWKSRYEGEPIGNITGRIVRFPDIETVEVKIEAPSTWGGRSQSLLRTCPVYNCVVIS